jgi:two-component system cell cycle response regulator DivK
MSNFQGKQALIIEDDMPSVEVLQMLLEQVLVDSDVIGDNQNIAEDLDEVNVPDIIFLDLEMPMRNGYKVLEMIQSKVRFDEIPVVAYTTHVSHLNDAKKAGFHSFIGKPLDSSRFAEQLERILNGESVWEVPS